MANRAERRRMMRQQEAQNKKHGTDAKDPAIMAKIDAWEKNGGASAGAAYSGMMAEKDQQMHIKLAVREQVRKIIEHNGITEDDLEEEWEKGRQFGFKHPLTGCSRKRKGGREHGRENENRLGGCDLEPRHGVPAWV